MSPLNPPDEDNMTYYPPIDPGGGLQKGSTASSALGFVTLLGSGSDSLASALGLGAHPQQVMAAGFSLGLGRLDLFSVGLLLVALGIILNIMSMAVRHQRFEELKADAAKARAAKARREEPPASPAAPRPPLG
jgi:hypothetical protein